MPPLSQLARTPPSASPKTPPAFPIASPSLSPTAIDSPSLSPTAGASLSLTASKRLSLVKRCSANDLGGESDAEEDGSPTSRPLPGRGRAMTTHDLLKDGNHIFKPLQQSTNGLAERDFYEHIQAFAVKRFCPAFFGCRRLDDQGVEEDYEYLVIEDLTSGFGEAAMMDLKMGKKKFYAVAAEKGCEERYPADKCKRQAADDLKRTSGKIGILVSGIHAPAFHDRPAIHYRGDDGKSLSVEECLAAVKTWMLQSGAEGTQVIARAFRDEIADLLTWYEREQTHVFYNSSLLFAYDMKNPSKERAKVKVIDFCHSWEKGEEEEDKSGFVDGLHTVLRILDEIQVEALAKENEDLRRENELLKDSVAQWERSGAVDEAKVEVLTKENKDLRREEAGNAGLSPVACWLLAASVGLCLGSVISSKRL